MFKNLMKKCLLVYNSACLQLGESLFELRQRIHISAASLSHANSRRNPSLHGVGGEKGVIFLGVFCFAAACLQVLISRIPHLSGRLIARDDCRCEVNGRPLSNISVLTLVGYMLCIVRTRVNGNLSNLKLQCLHSLHDGDALTITAIENYNRIIPKALLS